MKKGMVIYLTFMDHVSGDIDILECELWGRVEEVTEEFVHIVAWDVKISDQETRKANQESFKILRKVVTGWGELRIKRWNKTY